MPFEPDLACPNCMVSESSEIRTAWARAEALGLALRPLPARGGSRSRRPNLDTGQCFFRSALRGIQNVARGDVLINMTAWRALRCTLIVMLASGRRYGASAHDIQIVIEELSRGLWPPHSLGYLVFVTLADLVGESVFLVLAKGVREYSPNGSKSWTESVPPCAIILVGYGATAEASSLQLSGPPLQLEQGYRVSDTRPSRILHFESAKSRQPPTDEQMVRFREAQQRIIREGGLSLGCNNTYYVVRQDVQASSTDGFSHVAEQELSCLTAER
eukprot:TRINITY_DN43011_c0_g1_i1.p1 TRINITY_DN43011_c0_g1~~TRINITY_DN43011_c0_g1_i1.p1  ORF type:complete len:273 (+),score=34.84 TRINITY_DN43011_c0_g1_i1:77-895(+)